MDIKRSLNISGREGMEQNLCNVAETATYEESVLKEKLTKNAKQFIINTVDSFKRE